MACAREQFESSKLSYNGQLYVELRENLFTFRPTNGIRQFCIFYEVSTLQTSLSMKIKRSEEGPSLINITVEEIDASSKKEVILEIILETPAIMMDCMKEEYRDFKKSLQMFGQYSMSSPGRIVEAVFRHDDSSEYVAMVNGHTKVYDAYLWMCGSWSPRCECTEYWISTKEGPVGENQTFLDCSSSVTSSFHVAEKCMAKSMTTSEIVALPWNKACSVLHRTLACMLAKDVNQVRLLDFAKKPLYKEPKLIIKNFREENSKEPPTVWYDVTRVTVACTTLIEPFNSVEVTTLTLCNVLELKIILANELKTDHKTLILFQKDKFLLLEDLIDENVDVKYYIGTSMNDLQKHNRLGEGGYGEVYRYTSKATNQVMAMKSFVDISKDGRRISVFRELLTVFTVPHHENLVCYFNIYASDNEILLGMEFISGGSLQDRIMSSLQEDEALSEGVIGGFGRGILKGLAHLHQRNVIHRDIKGHNVLIGEGEVAKLCDFGISKILEDNVGRDVSENVSQSRNMGTSGYMAPEVVLEGKYGLRADIWSFGATLVAMRTGRPPYGNLEKQQHGGDLYPYHNFSDELNELVGCCLRELPKERPNAQDLLKLPFFQK